MSENKRPDLSVVLATPKNALPGLGAVVRSLSAQTGKERLELVIVVPSREMAEVGEEELRGFWGAQIIEIGPFDSWSRAMVVGMLAAQAEWVVLGEDHSYVAPGWAEALIETQRENNGDWVAVGPSVDNANPGTGMSWATLVLNYGLWLRPKSAQGKAAARTDIPSHNSSYRREALLALGEGPLREMLRYNRLHAKLLEAGQRLCVDERAVVFHLNPSRWLESLPVRFAVGRQFGGVRAREGGWSVGRRALYVVASPLIPFMGLRAVVRNLRRSGRWDVVRPSFVCAIGALVAVAAAGEVVGYILGPGDMSQPRADAEFERFGELCKSDQLAQGAVYSKLTPAGAT